MSRHIFWNYARHFINLLSIFKAFPLYILIVAIIFVDIIEQFSIKHNQVFIILLISKSEQIYSKALSNMRANVGLVYFYYFVTNG